jgi:hypothetical protein
MGEPRKAYRLLVGKPEGRRLPNHLDMSYKITFFIVNAITTSNSTSARREQ